MSGIVALVVLTTITVWVGTSNPRGQARAVVEKGSTPPGGTPNYDTYPTVAFDTMPEARTAAEIEERKIKNKRYDVSLTVMSNPPHDSDGLVGFDVEPDPPAIPYAESLLVVVGNITDVRAFLSNQRQGVYTEYTVNVETILKQVKEKELKSGDVVVADRAGGVVRYSTGQKILYELAGLKFPVKGGRYLFFLGGDDPKNPNYKIITAYRLRDGKVTALDQMNPHLEFNGKTEADFIRLVSGKKTTEETVHRE